jgi:hypothetical protein
MDRAVAKSEYGEKSAGIGKGATRRFRIVLGA